jgi:hypothetical protein
LRKGGVVEKGRRGEVRREFSYQVDRDWQVIKAKKVIPFSHGDTNSTIKRTILQFSYDFLVRWKGKEWRSGEVKE